MSKIINFFTYNYYVVSRIRFYLIVSIDSSVRLIDSRQLKVKSVLEFSLWGPADVPLGGPREREVALQRWLDLERANVLHALVKTKAALTVIDEYQLLFLVRTTAKIMSEASVLLDEQRNRLARKC